MKFWQEQKVYPKLAKLAKWILSVTASSERVFSCAGVYGERRNRLLSPESTDTIVFLKSFFSKTNLHQYSV